MLALVAALLIVLSGAATAQTETVGNESADDRIICLNDATCIESTEWNSEAQELTVVVWSGVNQTVSYSDFGDSIENDGPSLVESNEVEVDRGTTRVTIATSPIQNEKVVVAISSGFGGQTAVVPHGDLGTGILPGQPSVLDVIVGVATTVVLFVVAVPTSWYGVRKIRGVVRRVF